MQGPRAAKVLLGGVEGGFRQENQGNYTPAFIWDLLKSLLIFLDPHILILQYSIFLSIGLIFLWSL